MVRTYDLGNIIPKVELGTKAFQFDAGDFSFAQKLSFGIATIVGACTDMISSFLMPWGDYGTWGGGDCAQPPTERYTSITRRYE